MNNYPTDFARFGNRSFGLGWSSEIDIAIRAASRHVFSLGGRPVEEAFLEIARGPLGPCPVLDLLERYGRLTPAMVAAVGADRPLRPRLLLVPK